MPEPKGGENGTEFVTFRAPPALVRALDAKAEKEHRSRSAVILIACERALAEDAT